MIGGHGDVQAQHLAEQRVGPLRVVERVVSRAAVAEADVEIAVGAEGEMAAVVIGERLLDVGTAVRPHEIAARLRRGRVTVVGAAFEARHHGVPVAVGEVDEHAAGVDRTRREGEAQQPALAAAADGVAQVQEGRLAHRRPFEHEDEPALRDDQERARGGRVLDHGDRVLDAARHGHQPQFRRDP
jgi:hypothetical protein